MDTPARKIDQLVSDARIELKRLGIETKGKRSDEAIEDGPRAEKQAARGATQTALNSGTRNQGPIVSRVAAIDRGRHLKARLKTQPRPARYLKGCPRC